MKTQTTITPVASAVEIAKEAVFASFSDCHEFWKERGFCPPRNLNFCCPVTVSRNEAVEITQRFVPGYNIFRPNLLIVLPADCRIRLAREGSFCVYAETTETLNPTKTKKELRCDEFHLWQSFGGTNTYRIF